MMLDTLIMFLTVFAAAKDSDAAAGAMGVGFVVCYIVFILAFYIVTAIGMWKAFEKAGEPGWAAIIPIYNFIVMCKIADKPLWWIALGFIPGCGGFILIVLNIIVCIEIATRFGKGGGFGVGLALLGFIFWPILGFGSAQWQGGGGGGGGGRGRRDIDEDHDRPSPRGGRPRDEDDEGIRRPRRRDDDDEGVQRPRR
jgi:hypothetical protein